MPCYVSAVHGTLVLYPRHTEPPVNFLRLILMLLMQEHIIRINLEQFEFLFLSFQCAKLQTILVAQLYSVFHEND